MNSMDTGEMLDSSSVNMYSSELASQDKMIIRIKKQEPYVDIEGKDSSSDSDEVVSYTCEFVQKVDENKSELDDLCDEPMESIRQDENFIYPAITNSDDEDTKDTTWQPPLTVLTPEERLNRKHIKCLYPKVEKTQPKKRKYKTVKTNKKELTVKETKKGKVLANINVSKPDADFAKPDVTTTNGLTSKKYIKKKSPTSTKVSKPRKGMATAKQRLGRIIKIHKMMK